MKGAAISLAAGLGLTGAADAAEILVTSDIATSETWTRNNTYNLQDQIYVLPGATLTIEAGTVIASTTNLGGSLAITRGADIIAKGTKDRPIIFTSKADVATWDVDVSHPTGKDPKTGTWREGANEWGNLTIMGEGFISENASPQNVDTCDPGNRAAMEGLVAAFPGDTKVLYGGGNDFDDSGCVEYVSFRYGGRVIGLGNELNGLSLGGIGNGTDINHIEIMNNVDDGIEIWGGCVDLHHISIWNIGDDSLDIDQGYRGRVQFGLIVQGYSLDADQGSGVGDNCIETDGAEDSDWQPVSQTVMYNMTVIGQPVDGDGATAWRDNANVQYRNSIFMDCGEKVVRFDNVDGDGANGYGFNGTISWVDRWTTPTFAKSCGNWNPQFDGRLCEITDSVFFRNLNADAYTEATARGVFDAPKNNVLIPGFDDADSPVTTLTRGAPVVKGGKTMVPVTFLDPRPANEALTSVGFAPIETEFGYPFFPACWDAVKYRGAFAPDMNWLAPWTASTAYGFTPAADSSWCDIGFGLGGLNGEPLLSGTGFLIGGGSASLILRNHAPSSGAVLASFGPPAPTFAFGGLIVTVPILINVPLPLFAADPFALPFVVPAGVPAGFKMNVQFAVSDGAAPFGVSLSNALVGTFE